MELLLVQKKIYEIRGQKVMLDADLAEFTRLKRNTLNEL
jgi:hypothetical protein